MILVLEWFGKVTGALFALWLIAFVARQYALERRCARCTGCGRLLASPLDLTMHQFDCQLATGSQPTRRSAHRVGALDTSKSRHR